MAEEQEEKSILEQNGAVRVHPNELGKHTGKYVILWRKKRKMVAKIESVDAEEKRILYSLVSGPDKGERIRSRYDTSQTVYVCSDEQLMLALMFAQS